MVAPVPDAHLSFIDAIAVLSPVFSSSLNMMILASCPPSSMTLADVGVQVLDGERDRVDFLDELAAGRVAQSGAEPEPVRNMRQPSFGWFGNAARIVSSSSSTFSGCFVWWRW